MSPANVDLPNRLVMWVPEIDPKIALAAAYDATWLARRMAPKLTGAGAQALIPYVFANEFGIAWPEAADHLWYQETGTMPFTMRSLAGRTIPMWIEDPTGSEHRKNPDAETRVINGRRQVKIFRRVGKIGATKRVNGRTVPQSYPGAPGRIVARGYAGTYPTGRLTGQIASPVARPHVGVRWRHPGIVPRGFMHQAIERTAAEYGLSGSIRPGYGAR